MHVSRPDIPFTYEHYKTLSAFTDARHELIDGDLYRVPAPTVAHQTASKNIALRLEAHVRATGCGRMFYAPLDVVLGEGETSSRTSCSSRIVVRGSCATTRSPAPRIWSSRFCRRRRGSGTGA